MARVQMVSVQRIAWSACSSLGELRELCELLSTLAVCELYARGHARAIAFARGRAPCGAVTCMPMSVLWALALALSRAPVFC